MSVLKIPSVGLTLHHEQNPTPKEDLEKQPTQTICLNLLESAGHDLLRALRNKEHVKIRLGKKAALNYGKKSVQLGESRSTFPSELFSTRDDGFDQLYFSGSINHVLEARKAQEVVAKTDAALAALENTLKTMQEERSSNEANFVRTKEDIKQLARKEHRPSPLLSQKDRFASGMASSRPSSPFLKASFSPGLGPASAPLPSGLSAKDKVRLDAMRIPMLHLLAARPMTSEGLRKILHAPKDDCDRVLEKVAKPLQDNEGKKELKEKSYRELDVWKFPYQKQEDRQAAIDRAVQAYDRMRIERSDNLWQLLLPNDERGKGKTLSRLNFDKPAQKPATPRPHVEDGDDIKVEASDKERAKLPAKKKTVAQGTSQERHEKKKISKDAISSRPKDLKETIRPESAQGKNNTPKPAPQPAKQAGKFKSSEVIENSDEEAETVSVVAAKPNSSSTLVKRKAQPASTTTSTSVRAPKITSNLSPNKNLQRTHQSKSSTAGSETKRSSDSHPLPNKTLHPRPKNDTVTARVSPRPRTGSSPQKPSPLGSSPPTNSTDLDSSGSSKPPSHSSATSSPPSSIDMARVKHASKGYSPVVEPKGRGVLDQRDASSKGRPNNNRPDRDVAKRSLEKSTDRRGRSPAQDPDDSSIERPAKRQKITSHEPTARKTVTTTTKVRDSPPPTSKSSKSGSESPAPSKDGLVEQTKKFFQFFEVYKEAYHKLYSVPADDRDEKELERLLKMHRRMKAMEEEIWKDYHKVETEEDKREAEELLSQRAFDGKLDEMHKLDD